MAPRQTWRPDPTGNRSQGHRKELGVSWGDAINPRVSGWTAQNLLARSDKCSPTCSKHCTMSALKLRQDNSREITNEADFRDFFTSANENEIHGGFAHCHFANEIELEPLLKELESDDSLHSPRGQQPRRDLFLLRQASREESGLCESLLAIRRPSLCHLCFLSAY